MKLAIDGASKTKKSKFIAVTLDDLSVPIEDVHSERNAHLLAFCFGGEEKQNLRALLFPLVNDLFTLAKCDNKIRIVQEGIEKEVKVNLFLCCDLVCLAKVMGFNAVYHPKSIYKCTWCEVTEEDLDNFDITTWAFRDITKVVEVGQTQESRKVENITVVTDSITS